MPIILLFKNSHIFLLYHISQIYVILYLLNLLSYLSEFFKNLLVAQSGGPTSAINATLAGVIENALSSPSVDKIYGSVNGIQGVLNENLIDLKIKITNVSELDLLCQTPASALGSCRVKLKDPAVCADEYETIISVLRKYSIDCFIYIGGNDSMDTVD